MGVFESFSDFMAMDGHGIYVWLSYAVATAVIVFNIVSPRLLRNRLISEHKRRLRREQR
ncbi:MAG: heme exporter protein CcmD [Saccharospirillum sp.]|nr:heme exporter protein CcmD [Saccharospirillum sp.]